MADPNSERDPLEALAADYMERLRQGQPADIEDYAARHPDLADDIRELFPTIVMTERLKLGHARSSDGRATLGPARLERLGDFRIIREIGRGGMGVVFEAEQESLGRRVALKVLPRQVLLDAKHLKRFEREARIAANLHHTNIVEVFGVGEQDGFHYYVMQYISGVGLDAVVPLLARAARTEGSRASQAASAFPASAASEDSTAEAVAQQLLGAKTGPQPCTPLGRHYWLSVARIGRQAADALAYAHSRGVLHRDIKPANLLLDTQSTVWLADFGLAKATQSDDISQPNDLVGTLRYMAPEQFRGETDHRSDIYSLGLTLYELLALRAAYEETDSSRLIQRIIQGRPPAPSSVGRELPRDLETIILKAVSHDPGQRYPSAEAMADDLRCFLEDRPISARRVSPVERLGRWCHRNPSLAALTGAVLFLLVVVAVVASVGYIRTRNALRGEAAERAKAEANATLAVEALDRMFARFSPTRMRLLPQTSAAAGGAEPMDLPSSPILSKEAAALLEEMLPFYDRLAQQTGGDGQVRTRAAEANRRVGAIRQRLGQSEAAAEAYRRALSLYNALRAASPAQRQFSLQVAQIENDLGWLYASRRRPADAREAHLAALALLQQADAGAPSAPADLRFELARTSYFLGTQERPLPSADPRREPRPAEARGEERDRLDQAVALLKGLPLSPATDPEPQHLLALCYLEGATSDDKPDNPREGGADRAIEILENLATNFPAIPDYAYDLSEAYARMHMPPPPIAPDTQAKLEDRLRRSLALSEKLVAQHPDAPDFSAAVARVHEKLGALYRQVERWEDAEREFRKAIALQGHLAKEFPNEPYYTVWLATFRIALGDALIHRNQAGEACTELEGAIATLLRQLEQRPELPRPGDLLALGYSKLATALRQTSKDDKADEAAHKAEEERKPTDRPL